MHRMEKFLIDCIEYTECHMETKHFAEMTPWERDYIANCCELCLKVMGVIAGKRMYDRYIWHDHDHEHENGVRHAHEHVHDHERDHHDEEHARHEIMHDQVYANERHRHPMPMMPQQPHPTMPNAMNL